MYVLRPQATQHVKSESTVLQDPWEILMHIEFKKTLLVGGPGGGYYGKLKDNLFYTSIMFPISSRNQNRYVLVW